MGKILIVFFNFYDFYNFFLKKKSLLYGENNYFEKSIKFNKMDKISIVFFNFCKFTVYFVKKNLFYGENKQIFRNIHKRIEL